MVPVAPIDALYWVFLALGIITGLLSITTLVLLGRVHYYLKKWTTQKLLQVMIFLCSCTRCIFFLGVHFHWVYVTVHWDEQNSDSILNGRGFPTWLFILNELPGVLFFSTSTILLLSWAKVYYTSQDRVKVYDIWFRPLCITANVCVYIMQVSFWTLYALSSNFQQLKPALTPLRVVSSSCIAIVFAITAFILVVFGNRTRTALSSIPVEFRIVSGKVNEVRALGIICTLCFTLRSGFIAYGTISNLVGYDKDLPGISPLILICGYYILFETLPCILILYYFRRLPPPPPAEEQLLDSGGHGPQHDYRSISNSNHNNNVNQNSGNLDGPSSTGSNSSRSGTKFGFDQEYPGQQYVYQINNGR